MHVLYCWLSLFVSCDNRIGTVSCGSAIVAIFVSLLTAFIFLNFFCLEFDCEVYIVSLRVLAYGLHLTKREICTFDPTLNLSSAR